MGFHFSSFHLRPFWQHHQPPVLVGLGQLAQAGNTLLLRITHYDVPSFRVCSRKFGTAFRRQTRVLVGGEAQKPFLWDIPRIPVCKAALVLFSLRVSFTFICQSFHYSTSGPSGSGLQCVTRTIRPWHVHLPSSKYTHNPGFGGGYPEGSLMMHKTTSDTPHELEISGSRSVTGTHFSRSCSTAISRLSAANIRIASFFSSLSLADQQPAVALALDNILYRDPRVG